MWRNYRFAWNSCSYLMPRREKPSQPSLWSTCFFNEVCTSLTYIQPKKLLIWMQCNTWELACCVKSFFLLWHFHCCKTGHSKMLFFFLPDWHNQSVNFAWFNFLEGVKKPHQKCSLLKLLLGQTFFVLWFTDIFGQYSMSGFGIKIEIKFCWCQTYICSQCTYRARESLFLHKLKNLTI